MVPYRWLSHAQESCHIKKCHVEGSEETANSSQTESSRAISHPIDGVLGDAPGVLDSVHSLLDTLLPNQPKGPSEVPTSGVWPGRLFSIYLIWSYWSCQAWCKLRTTHCHYQSTGLDDVSQSEWFGSDKYPKHNTYQRAMKMCEWWCASAEPEGKSLMGRGMLLHQRDDADADRGHSWWLGVIKDEGEWRLEPSYSLGSARMNTELNKLK